MVHVKNIFSGTKKMRIQPTRQLHLLALGLAKLISPATVTKLSDNLDLDLRTTISDEVNQLLSDHPILDGHNDLPWVLRSCLSNNIYDGRYNWNTNLAINPQPWMDGSGSDPTYPNRPECTSHAKLDGERWVATDGPRAELGKLKGQFWSVYVGCGSQYKDAIRQTVEQIDVAKRLAYAYPDEFKFCGDSTCVRQAWSEGKFASLIGMEGGHSIDSSMAMIRIYYELGARYMTITHFCNTPWADYSEQQETNRTNTVSKGTDRIGGLTDFGEKVIIEMQRVGILVDVSHVSKDTMLDVFKVAQCPVMYSHSNSDAVFPHHRNADDETLFLLEQNDGVIMVNWYHGYLTNETELAKTSLNDVADHIHYIRNLIGARHIGMGADLDGLPFAVAGGEDVSAYPILFQNLKNRGWTDTELIGIASENILRVMKACEDFAATSKANNVRGWTEDWISKADLLRISVDEVIEDSRYEPTCKTDLDLHPATDSDNYSLVQEIIQTGFVHERKDRAVLTVDEMAPKASTNVLLVDGHNDLPWRFRKNVRNQIKYLDLTKNMRDDDTTEYWIPNHTDFARAELGGLTAQFWSAFVLCTSNFKDAVRQTFEQIDVIHRMVEMYPERLEFVRTSEELETAVANGKLASMIGVEGGHSIDSSLEVLRAYYDLGVRYMTLAHNCNPPWIDNNQQDKNDGKAHGQDYLGGIESFAGNVILEMNRLGMMVDLSHTSVEAMLAALSISKAPVIFSHSSIKAIENNVRNVPDEVLEKLKLNGGVIMLVSLPDFVGNSAVQENTSSGGITNITVSHLADHARYLADKIGHQHIGIGADFDGMDEVLEDMRDVSEYENFWIALRDRGFTEEEILDIKGRNLLRVFREVEKVKEALKWKLPDETWIDRKSLERFERAKCRTDLELHPVLETSESDASESNESGSGFRLTQGMTMAIALLSLIFYTT